ncbi:hypothetical protein HY311_01115 [Candidatus Nomurabacteria bacterium]|nr:hypothetical protein [Candidatus Nomurabacteria bacterium]
MTKESENSNGAGKNLEHSAIVETYSGDMAEVLESDTEGLIKKIIHGEEEHSKEQKEMSPESKKNRLFMIIGIVLIAIALIILSFFLFRKNASTVPVAQQFIPIVFNDQITYLEISGLKKDQIAQAVLNDIDNTKVKVGGLEGIYPTENKKIIGLRRFISLTESGFAPGDNPLFINDNFLMGDVNSPAGPASELAGKDFFMLIKVRQTADVFAPMRAWEKNLFVDLRGFLSINTGSDTSYLLSKNFEDGIIENKNARILYDQNKQIVLMYIFANDNSVIITGSEAAAHEVLLRLASGK